MKTKEMKKGYFPHWMKEPIPEEDKLRWISKEKVINRLRNGERIIFSEDGWMKRADWIYFENDNYQKLRVRKITFNCLLKKEIIILNDTIKNDFSKRTVYIFNNQNQI